MPSSPSTSPPPELAQVAPGWTATLAYRLVPSLTTWRLSHPDGAVRFAKIDTSDGPHYPSLEDEAERMCWARAFLPVPRVVGLEQLGPVKILVTEALPGKDGTDPCWHRDLPALVRALGTGLRAFHEATDEASCPFRFDLDRALAHVHQRVVDNDIDSTGFHPEHAGLTPSAALRRLEATVPVNEDLVVCHGDYCPPNVLVAGSGVTGYVDLGELGVADRWWDVAVGAWSAEWNFGPTFEMPFYESYGIDPDHERITFYRLLYDLVS